MQVCDHTTCVLKILFVDDVVTVKYCPRLVPADFMATFSGIMALTIFLTAVLLRS